VDHLPNQAPSDDSELVLDPESPMFFAQTHDEIVRANHLREMQGMTPATM